MLKKLALVTLYLFSTPISIYLHLLQGQPLSLEGETQFGIAAGGGDGALVGHGGGQRQLLSGQQYNHGYSSNVEAPYNEDSYGFRSLDIRHLQGNHHNNGGGEDGGSNGSNPPQAWIVYPKGAAAGGGGNGDNGRPFTAKPLSLGGMSWLTKYRVTIQNGKNLPLT